MYKTTNKIIASMLVLILTLAQLSLIGIYGKEVYATDSNLENQVAATNNENVEFDAYFMMGEEKTHTATSKISEGNNIYAKINVNTTGYLKTAQIEFKDANFKLINQTQNAIIQKIDEEKSVVTLNQIDSKKEQIIEIPIAFNYSEEILPSEFSKESKVIFTGSYIDKDGEENRIEKEIKLQQNWKEPKEDMEAILEESVTKFIPYTIGKEEGLLVQTTVVTSLTNNALPIKTTTIEAKVPTINGIKPTSVKVYANSTEATNGQETGLNFTEDNYTYNKETNTLTIKVQNPIDENGKIKWFKEATDEYKITYTYSKEVRDYVLSENYNEKLQLETKATIDLYTYGETTEIKTITQEVSYKGQIGNIAEVSIENVTQNLSKGYIYANYVSENKIETIYNQKIVAEVASAELTNKIVIEQNEENFVAGETKHPTTVAGNNYTYYKNISINKNIINKILGEDAEINIYSGETLIQTINKEQIEKAEETITIDLSSKNINTIKIETSKPVAEGELVFNIQKAIKGTIDYSKAQMQAVEKIVTTLKAKVNEQETESSNEITFIEPQSKAEITIDKTNLSTILKNENVKITAILKTDNINNSLFKNPTITIKLPKYIETIEIKDKEVLFDKELTINSIKTVENTDGTKSIVVELKGEQTKYNIDSITGGTNIVITADLTVNKLTSNRTEQITMNYTNANTTTTGETTTTVNFVAPTGVVTTTTIEGYAEGKEKLTAISGETVTAQLATMQAAREATFNMSVINNYNNTIDTIGILGRLPFEGNKHLITGEDLGSTFNMTLKSAITVTGVDETKIKVYYSTNPEATTDIGKTENGWTETVENYETIKSYLIVVDEILNTADAINFTYTVQIPEGLQYNETAVENYIVYFNNNLETGTIEDKQLSAPVTITTGLGPVLEAQLVSNYTEDQVVGVGEYIEYTVKVKNVGTLAAEEVVVIMPVPQYVKLVTYNEETDSYIVDYTTEIISIDVGSVKIEEKVEKTIKLKVIDSSSNEQGYIEKVKVQASIFAKNIPYQIDTNQVINSITQPYYNILNNAVENYGDLTEGEEFEFEITVCTTESASENTIAKIPLPEGLEYINTTVTSYDYLTSIRKDETAQINYDEKTNTLTVNVGNVTNTFVKNVVIKVKVENLKENEYKHILKTYAQVSGDNINAETSEIKEYTVTKVGLEVKQTSNIPNETSVQYKDELTYIITIKNIGQRATQIVLEDNIPTGLNFKNLEYTINNETKITNTIKHYILIGIGETVTVKVNTVVGAVNENTNIVNSPIIKIVGFEDIQVNSVSHTIEKYKIPEYTGGGSEGEQPDITSKNKISGLIWEDINKNGMYDSNEKLFNGIEVLLLNANTNKVFNQTVTTNKNGIYTFTNVPQGNYIVIFLYDSGKYSATTYKAEGIDETINSDAIDNKITLNGENLNVAITNNITIEDRSIYNVNLGLIDNPKFDLNINKSISKITVQNPTGTKVYEYNNNENLVKLEFEEKYLGQTTIVVEYKITVTNEGEIEGYVKKIADYLPKEMNFSSELNRDWYENENGIIYNSSLANTKILPGESKEVILKLTKLVNESNLGTINNNVEIYEAYNDKGLKDIDSEPGNKASNEDDISKADIVLSIKTGKMVAFLGLTLTIILIIGTSAYFIKKKVLR